MISAEELRWIAGSVGSGLIGALLLWAKASRTRRNVSEDNVETQANNNRTHLLEEFDKRIEAERTLRLAAETRERESFIQLQRAEGYINEYELKVRLRDERIQKLENRVTRLANIVAKMHPELQGWLVTQPGDIADLEPEVEFKPKRN